MRINNGGVSNANNGVEELIKYTTENNAQKLHELILQQSNTLNLDICNDQGESLLMICAKRGFLACAQVLLYNGANVWFLAPNQKEALSLICRNKLHEHKSFGTCKLFAIFERAFEKGKEKYQLIKTFLNAGDTVLSFTEKVANPIWQFFGKSHSYSTEARVVLQFMINPALEGQFTPSDPIWGRLKQIAATEQERSADFFNNHDLRALTQSYWPYPFSQKLFSATPNTLNEATLELLLTCARICRLSYTFQSHDTGKLDISGFYNNTAKFVTNFAREPFDFRNTSSSAIEFVKSPLPFDFGADPDLGYIQYIANCWGFCCITRYFDQVYPAFWGDAGGLRYVILYSAHNNANNNNNNNNSNTSANNSTNNIFVCFRGTHGQFHTNNSDFIRNWGHNLNSASETHPLYQDSKLHQGFFKAFTEIEKPCINDVKKVIASHCDRNNPLKLIFCGHSLGGALAQICASLFLKIVELVGVQGYLITFGSPRVGDKAFAEKMMSSKLNIFRVRNFNDPVTYVPGLISNSIFRQNFTHFGEPILLKDNEIAIEDYNENVTNFFSSGVSNLLDNHSINLYQSRIEDQLKKLSIN